MMLLEAHHLELYVQDRLLIKVDHLQIHKNERIGLVGINGSGKTTLLQILARLKSPDEGTVTSNAVCELLPQLKRTDSTKSGGEVTQIYIREAINKNPQILLADEPTTNLDTSHIEWLEKKLMNWRGAFIVVSHDRAFLDQLCTTIWEIDQGQLKVYKGNYSQYANQKQLERQQQEMEHIKYEQKKKQLLEALETKERKAERATKKPKNVSSSEARLPGAKPYFAKKQKKLQQNAKAMETRLEKLEKPEKTKDIPPIKMNILNQQTFTGRITLRVNELSGLLGERVLWKAVSFHVRGGEKIAIIGPNGCGKTTLVKKIIEQEEGVTLSPSMKIGYFSQNIDVLKTDQSILENVRSSSKQEETLIRTVLARLLFFKEDVYKLVEVLSGGERVKVALAKLFVSEINTLILDEPTKFLDIEAVESLESLLQEYEGTVIVVSHDRRLIENVATRILAIENKEIQSFAGTYEQYKHDDPQASRNIEAEQRMVLETKISEVLSRLSIEPSDDLEMQFQKLLIEKREMDNK